MTFIKGASCELRVLTDEDADPFTAAVNAGLTTEHLMTGSIPMRTKDYAEKFRRERDAGDVLLGVWVPHCEDEECSSFKLIGTCGLHAHRDIYRSWEARFLIFDPDAVGKGIGKEVVTMLTRYAFERLNAHRVWLGVSEFNVRAVKCYLDCGYRLEGRLVDEVFYGGKYHAALRMAVLEGEWTSLSSATAK